MLVGFDHSNYFTTKKPTERLEILAGAMSHIVDQDDGKKRFKKAANDLMKSAKLCGAHEAVIEKRDDLVFFDTNDRSVAEYFGIVDESKFYVPLVYTYNGFGSFFPIVSDHGYLELVSDFKKALGFSISKII